MIRVEKIWHHYGIRPILKDVSFTVEPGELVAVMGPNGMGKSTILSVIAGIMSPIEGTVEINGLVRRSSIENEIAIRKQVFYLPDDDFLPITHTGRELLVATARLYGVSERRLMEHSDMLLKIFALEKQADSAISSYSTGQKKKISLCTALMSEAPVLILDEPLSGGLDSMGLHTITSILKDLAARRDVTVLMAVPVPELVKPLAHKIAVLVDGELAAYDSPDNLCDRYDTDGDLGMVLNKLSDPESSDLLETYLGDGK